MTLVRAAESVAAQQRRCELSKGLVSRARMLYANSESNREPERARASKREPDRAGEQHLKHASTLFCCKTVKYNSVLLQNIKIRYFLSQNVKTRAMSRKNGINCAVS